MKAIIYVRTSTQQQEEQNQLPDCQDYCIKKGWEVTGIYQEQLSGYKDIERPERNKILELVKAGDIQHVVVWAFDRWVRNRDTLVEDVTVLSNYGVKLHSVKEAWLEAVNLEGALGRTLKDFLLGIIGSLAEMDSARKSERVKLAIRKENGVTKSYKGGKWGRPAIAKKVDHQIIEAHKAGKSMNEMSKTLYYWDHNNNQKLVSIGYIHKTITRYKQQNIS